MNRFLTLACIACLSMSSQSAGAYNYTADTCGNINFNNGYMTFNYANNLSTTEKVDVSTAFSRLTAFSDSGITTVDNADSSFSRGNGQNEIYHDTTHPSAQCWANFNTSTCNINEADIRFGDQSWVTGADSQHAPYTSGRSIMGVAIHEGGHCIGMGHENTVYNMMGSDSSHVTRNGTSSYYGPGEDLSDGLINLHGKRSTTDAHRDVGVTIMRYAFADGAYSSHQFGVLRDASNIPLPMVGSYEGQNVFEVIQGQVVRMELTFENNGEKNTEDANVGFYLSVNSIISTADLLLEPDTGYILSRNTPYEMTKIVTIPIATAPGDYYLGAFVDHDNLINETTSGNNAAYYPVKVVIPPPDMAVIFAGVDDSSLLPNQPFSILAVVKNEGTGPSTATSLRYYRSTNAIINSSDTLLGTDSIPALAANEVKAANHPQNAPDTEGTWWYGARVDPVPGEVNVTNQYSSGVQVTVAIQSPGVSTDAATDVGSVSTMLHATVTPNGGATTLYFDWGTDNQYDNTLTYGGIGSGLSGVGVNSALSGLICETTYQFRARAVNSAGTTIGNVQEFTTIPCPGCM